ncbi:hypothetical protein F5X99DRAFT_381753, partial [Biscogniauxia marginata]
MFIFRTATCGPSFFFFCLLPPSRTSALSASRADLFSPYRRNNMWFICCCLPYMYTWVLGRFAHQKEREGRNDGNSSQIFSFLFRSLSNNHSSLDFFSLGQGSFFFFSHAHLCATSM